MYSENRFKLILRISITCLLFTIILGCDETSSSKPGGSDNPIDIVTEPKTYLRIQNDTLGYWRIDNPVINGVNFGSIAPISVTDYKEVPYDQPIDISLGFYNVVMSVSAPTLDESYLGVSGTLTIGKYYTYRVYYDTTEQDIIIFLTESNTLQGAPSYTVLPEPTVVVENQTNGNLKNFYLNGQGPEIVSCSLYPPNEETFINVNALVTASFSFDWYSLETCCHATDPETGNCISFNFCEIFQGSYTGSNFNLQKIFLYGRNYRLKFTSVGDVVSLELINE